MLDAGALRELVAFDQPVTTPDGAGGNVPGWVETHRCAAEFRYRRGDEAVQTSGLQGSASFKVRVRSCEATRVLTTKDRMRDVRRGIAYNIREVDAISDRAHVWLVAESGVAI